MSNDFLTRLQRVLDSHTPERISVPGTREAAVLIPVIAGREPSLLFTVRTDTLPSHQGQISFPGGSVDASDASPEIAALRETEEELGLSPRDVRVVGELDSLETFVSGYVVTPIVGWLERRPTLRPNAAEVADVIEAPIAELTDDIRMEPGFSHSGRTFPTEAWVWRGHVIWGLTARILRQFLSRLAEAGLAHAPAETSPWSRPATAS